MACFYLPIPVRPDRALRPLDLTRSVRLGSVCNVSINDLLWADGSGSDG
jgi:hypothetical protein